MMYKKMFFYSCDEGERFEVKNLKPVLDGELVFKPRGEYVDGICIDDSWYELYNDNGDYTAYGYDYNDESYDNYGEQVDIAYQHYVDNKYEN